MANPSSLSSKPYTLKQLVAKTPRNIQYNAEDTKVKQAKKFVDRDSGQPSVVAVVYSTHDADGNPTRSPILHKCYISGLDGKSKAIGNSHVNLSCTCGYFLYTLEYALNKRGNADIIFSNGKPALVKNPTNKSYLCKHLYHLAEVIISRGM